MSVFAGLDIDGGDKVEQGVRMNWICLTSSFRGMSWEAGMRVNYV